MGDGARAGSESSWRGPLGAGQVEPLGVVGRGGGQRPGRARGICGRRRVEEEVVMPLEGIVARCAESLCLQATVLASGSVGCWAYFLSADMAGQ